MIFNNDISYYFITKYFKITISQLYSSPIYLLENQIQFILYQVIILLNTLFLATNRY